jgi:hypothetical protein
MASTTWPNRSGSASRTCAAAASLSPNRARTCRSLRSVLVVAMTIAPSALAYRVIDAVHGRGDRAKVYAGADLIFPEAMANKADFARFRAAIDTPILVNMTEFGKSTLLDARTLENLGVNVVIYPVTLLRLAMHAAGAGLAATADRGTQEGLLDQMQHRRDLYALLDYKSYGAFDSSVYNFKLQEAFGVYHGTRGLQGPGRRLRRHHGHLHGQSGNQLPQLPQLPGPGAVPPAQLRGSCLPAVAR